MIRELLHSVAEYAGQYLKAIKKRNVAPIPEALNRLNLLDQLLPDEPTKLRVLTYQTYFIKNLVSK